MAPLLGVLFAVLVALLAIRPYLSYQQQAFENVKAANTAAQFRQIIDAAKVYIQNNCTPTSCSSFSISNLINSGLLPTNTTSINPYGQAWNITVSMQTNALQAFVYSTGGLPIPPHQAPEIAAETGAEAGFMPTPGQYSLYGVNANTAVGAYGYWKATLPSGLSPIPVAGDLVAQLNVPTTALQDNAYLYRNPVLGDPEANTMNTSLDMGGNSINDATSVNTKDSSGNSASIGTDLSGKNEADLTVSGSSTTNVAFGNGGSGTTNVNIGQGSTGTSNLTIGGTSSGGGLILTSTAQTVGAGCTNAQLGTIAPNAGSSGQPVVCAATPQAGSLVVGNTGPIVILLNSPTWELMGSQNFTAMQEVTLQPFYLNGIPQNIGMYINSTPETLFISSNCPINSGAADMGGVPPNAFGTSLNFYVSSVDSIALSSVLKNPGSIEWTVSGVPTANTAASPSSSVVVPPNYAFAYSLYSNASTTPACQFMVAY